MTIYSKENAHKIAPKHQKLEETSKHEKIIY